MNCTVTPPTGRPWVILLYLSKFHVITHRTSVDATPYFWKPISHAFAKATSLSRIGLNSRENLRRVKVQSLPDKMATNSHKTQPFKEPFLWIFLSVLGKECSHHINGHDEENSMNRFLLFSFLSSFFSCFFILLLYIHVYLAVCQSVCMYVFRLVRSNKWQRHRRVALRTKNRNRREE